MKPIRLEEIRPERLDAYRWRLPRVGPMQDVVDRDPARRLEFASDQEYQPAGENQTFHG